MDRSADPSWQWTFEDGQLLLHFGERACMRLPLAIIVDGVVVGWHWRQAGEAEQRETDPCFTAESSDQRFKASLSLGARRTVRLEVQALHSIRQGLSLEFGAGGFIVKSNSWRAFVPDVFNRRMNPWVSQSVTIATAIDTDAQRKAGVLTFVNAPAPKVAAFRLEGGSSEGKNWLGIAVPGALPCAAFEYHVAEDRVRVVVQHWTPLVDGDAIELWLRAGLGSDEEALTLAVEAERNNQRDRSGPPSAEWWSQPIFCTWGEQTARNVATGQPVHLSQGDLVTWVNAVERMTGNTEFTICVDASWANNSRSWVASQRVGGTDGLRALIEAWHRSGHHVLLWLSPLDLSRTWDGDQLFDDVEELTSCVSGQPPLRDLSTEQGRAHLRSVVRYGLSEDRHCLNADGFKVDYNFRNPDPRTYSMERLSWGEGDQYWKNTMEFLTETARMFKSHPLLSYSGIAPWVQQYTGMLRLNDDASDSPVAWLDRASVGLRTLPGTLVDADGWSMTREKAYQYWPVSAVIGVPSLLHVTRFDGGDPWTADDQIRLAGVWTTYQNAPTRPSHRIVIGPGRHRIDRYATDQSGAARRVAYCANDDLVVTYSLERIRLTVTRGGVFWIPFEEGSAPTVLEAVHADGRRQSWPIETVRQTNPRGMLVVLERSVGQYHDILFWEGPISADTNKK